MRQASRAALTSDRTCPSAIERQAPLGVETPANLTARLIGLLMGTKWNSVSTLSAIWSPIPAPGAFRRRSERMRQMIDMAILADEAGLDIVGVGEHHGAGFVNSATAVTIAAMARATKQIR